MYTSFHCFVYDAQKKYWFIVAGLRFVVLFKDGKHPSERERLKMKAYGCAKMCEPSFNRRGLIRSGPQANIKMKKNAKSILSRDCD